MASFIIRDDYDEVSVCVIRNAPDAESAIALAERLYPDQIEGDAYPIAIEIIEFIEEAK
jgi:hypothetical protein